jgi:hypothetical protein
VPETVIFAATGRVKKTPNRELWHEVFAHQKIATIQTKSFKPSDVPPH